MPALQTPSRKQLLLEAVASSKPTSGLTHNFYRYPARFGSEFAREAIRYFSREGDLVLDPFPVETSVRRQIEFRRVQKEFIARGLAAREEARRTGVYYSKEEVMASLQSILDQAKNKQRP